jgi:hypothetical protein
MRALLQTAAVFLAISTFVLAATESLADLKSKANLAHGGDQAKFSMEYAHRLLEDSNALFTKGDVDKAQAEIREIVDYARIGANAAASSGKRQKQTEISLRELGKRMHDIGETLAFEDRGPVKEAVDEIEQVRSDLLAKMFQK